MPGDNGRGAIDLLGEHSAHHHVRPGGAAKAEQKIGTGAGGGIMAIGSADQEADFTRAAILPAAQPFGERGGGEIGAGFIKNDGATTGKARPGRGFANFDNRQRALQPRAIALDQIGFRAGTDPPTRDNREFQGRASTPMRGSPGLASSPKAHIFSRL